MSFFHVSTLKFRDTFLVISSEGILSLDVFATCHVFPSPAILPVKSMFRQNRNIVSLFRLGRKLPTNTHHVTESSVVLDSLQSQFNYEFLKHYKDTGTPLYVKDSLSPVSFEYIQNLIDDLGNVIYKSSLIEVFDSTKYQYFLFSFSKEDGTEKYFLNTFVGSQKYHDLLCEEIHKSSNLHNTRYIKWVQNIDSYGEMVYSTVPVQIPKPSFPSFYPGLKNLSLEEYIKAYIQSSANILLIIGEPGTGKSELLRRIIYEAGVDVLLTYNDELSKMDELFSHFYTAKEKFMIIEDADVYISSRNKDGNKTMKTLLNISDGLTARNDKKIIFTTNLPNLNHVDEALLRPGRCFDVLNIGKLTKEQAIAVATDIGLDTNEVVNKEYTLAELFNLRDGHSIQRIKNSKTGFGFTAG